MIHQLPKARITDNPLFSPHSKVWIYTAQRPFRADEEQEVVAQLNRFTTDWTAHNMALKATAEVFEHQIILLVVDETMAGASGCSIDKSVHFLENLGQSLGIDLFDRMRFGWLDDAGTVHFSSRDELSSLKTSGSVTPETWMLNTLASNKTELQQKWWLPLSESWHNRLI